MQMGPPEIGVYEQYLPAGFREGDSKILNDSRLPLARPRARNENRLFGLTGGLITQDRGQRSAERLRQNRGGVLPAHQPGRRIRRIVERRAIAGSWRPGIERQARLPTSVIEPTHVRNDAKLRRVEEAACASGSFDAAVRSLPN